MKEIPEPENQSMWGAIFALGVNFFLQGKYDKARIIFDGLITLDKEEPASSIAYGEILLIEGHHEKALDHFLTLSKKYGSDYRVLLGVAKTYVLLGQLEEAKKLMHPIVEGEIPSTPNAVKVAQLIRFC